MQQQVIALVRVSSEEQADEGRGGIERQWRDIEAVCHRDSLAISRRFQLEGVSGSTIKLNPQFQQMLKAVTAPGIVGLVISSPERLMRSHSLADLAVLEAFSQEEHPRFIWTAETKYDLRSFDGQLLFLMQTLVGGHEKKQILKRTQDGKRISRERGDKCADKPPVGVEFVVTDPKVRTGIYRFTAESVRVKKAFLRVLDRDTSIRAIASELGFNSYQSMRKQLTNPIWTGWRVSAEARERVTGPDGQLRHRRIPRLVPIRTRINLEGEPLISDEVFDEVQSVLAGINKEHVMRRSGRSRFALSGLIHCVCGQRFYSKHDDRNGKSGYYVCKSAYFKSANGCGNPILPRAQTDKKVIDLLSDVLSNTGRLIKMLTEALTPPESADLKAERDTLRQRIETLINRRTKIVDKVADGLITDEEARVSVGKLRADIEAANSRLSAIEGRLRQVPISDREAVVNSVVSYCEALRHRPPEERKTLLKTQIIKDIQLDAVGGVSAFRIKAGEVSIVVKDFVAAA